MSETVTCPSCTGARQVMLHVHRWPGPNEWRLMDCSTCRGTGAIAREHAELRAWGQQIRHLRVAARMSQAEMAQALGVPPHTYSHWEHGTDMLPQGMAWLETQVRHVIAAAGGE